MSNSRRTIRLTIEYDGGGLCGWQRQDNGPTVQQHVEECLEAMCGTATPVFGASRTDAGVHALGQVCHFHTDSDIPTDGFRLGLNSKLPPQIAIIEAVNADSDFHSRFQATGKHYRYQVWNRLERSPTHRRNSWHVRKPLQVAAMQRAGDDLVGEHDFTSFRAVGCVAKSPVRTITSVEVSRQDALITIDVCGGGFLRNMVRIVAGTLVECGEGRRDPTTMPATLAIRERKSAGQTAPPEGLTLVSVHYS